MHIPDNYDMWASNDARQEEQLKMLPKCRECKEPIQTEYCYGSNGKYICEDCLKEHYKHSVEDLI
jgi:formylmethanofuran dehydrogenase subunit E